MTRLLFAASEVVPLAKTGGLADVAAALPSALVGLGVDVRIVMPAYRGTLARLADATRIGEVIVLGQVFTVWQGQLPGAETLVWLLDCPLLYDREGDPYHDARHQPWPDNAWRFGCFSAAVARLALGEGNGGWRADTVHCNDWQTGLVPAWLSQQTPRPRCVYTIHNLAYAGQFGRETFDALELPSAWWSPEGVEFYGQLSFMKAGLVFSDVITTVSPSYAREILTPEFGCGLEGLLRSVSGKLHGILNGIDTTVWNPELDPLLAQNYTLADVSVGKRANRHAVQAALGLAIDDNATLIGMVGRMTEQKGTDLVLAALPELLKLPIQLAVLASGDKTQEAAFIAAAQSAPGRIGVRMAYDEPLAHRIEAGADLFLMPSRFEPCGLNQMYSQRYGTIPVVRRVGGLADTVVDTTQATLQDHRATGVVFESADAAGLLYGVRRAVQLVQNAAARTALQTAGMTRDYSWSRSAQEYLQFY